MILSSSYRRATRGFTLIELLVVIAIIGILSAVVLASLNTARSKGSDAAVKSNLDSVGSQAALFLTENNNTYGVYNNGLGGATTCPTPADTGTTVFHNKTIANAVASALKASSGGTAICLSTDDAYAVAVSRPVEIATTTSTYWCTDNGGQHCGINDASLTGASCGACVTTN